MISGKVIKQFQYLLRIDGIPAFSIQKLTTPDVEVEETLHSVGVYDEKTAGRIKVGDLVCERVMVYGDPQENLAWQWFMTVQNYEGGGLLPNVYRRQGELLYLAPDLVTILHTYELGNIWPKKIAGQELDRASSDNIMEEITFSVDKFRKKQ
jgi:phage tail-like protein